MFSFFCFVFVELLLLIFTSTGPNAGFVGPNAWEAGVEAQARRSTVVKPRAVSPPGH